MSKEISFRVWVAAFFVVLGATAVLLVAGLLYALRLVQQPSFAETVGDPFVELQETAFHLHNQSCDVLIDGDSTAGNGLDPKVITDQTGLTACNIATSRPIIDGVGTLPLDAFLRHNPKPRLILFQFGPEVFYRSRSGWDHVAPFPPIVMVARNGSMREAFVMALKHPAAAVQFVFYVIQARFEPKRVDRQRVHSEFSRIKEHAQETNGQIDLNMPSQTSCLAPAQDLYGPLDASWIHQLREKYEKLGITVLIRPAPIPDCDPQVEKFRRDLNSLLDFNIETLPINVFIIGDRHKTQQGTDYDTLLLVDSMKARYPDILNKH